MNSLKHFCSEAPEVHEYFSERRADVITTRVGGPYPMTRVLVVALAIIIVLLVRICAELAWLRKNVRL